MMRDLLVGHLLDRPVEYDNRYDKVLGFGIFDSEGQEVFSYRDAPESLDVRNGDTVDWQWSENRVMLIQTTEALWRYTRYPVLDPIADRFVSLPRADSVYTLYMSVELPPRTYPLLVLRYILFVFLILTLLAGAIFLRLSFNRYLGIRDELRSKEHLIVLGTAARTLAHEMKNPLSAIRLQTSLMRRENNREGTRSLDVIDEEVERLSSLMERTRSFLSNPQGNPQLLDLHDFLSKSRARFPADIRWKLPQGPKWIHIDSDRFQSIVENLLVNALESGSAISDIRVELHDHSGRYRFTVSDRGRGMAEEELSLATEPFTSTKTRGTGLGLFLVSRFIEAAGGRFQLRPRPDRGIEAAVELPRRSL